MLLIHQTTNPFDAETPITNAFAMPGPFKVDNLSRRIEWEVWVYLSLAAFQAGCPPIAKYQRVAEGAAYFDLIEAQSTAFLSIAQAIDNYDRQQFGEENTTQLSIDLPQRPAT